jgi:hypothetical protein
MLMRIQQLSENQEEGGGSNQDFHFFENKAVKEHLGTRAGKKLKPLANLEC